MVQKMQVGLILEEVQQVEEVMLKVIKVDLLHQKDLQDKILELLLLIKQVVEVVVLQKLEIDVIRMMVEKVEKEDLHKYQVM